MKKVLAKNPADGSTIDAARANANRDDEDTDGPIDDYPPRINPHNDDTNIMTQDLTEGALGVAAVGAGQAVTDELVEWLAERYGVGKGVMIHLLIEAGVPVAIGVGTHYLTDNQMARNVAIGILAAGSVNGARILVSEVKAMLMSDDSDDDDSSDSESMKGRGGGLGNLTPTQQRAVMSLPAQARRGFRQLETAKQRQVANRLIAERSRSTQQQQQQQQQRRREERDEEPIRSGSLGNSSQKMIRV